MFMNISLITSGSVDLSADQMVSCPPIMTSHLLERSPNIFIFQNGLVKIGKFFKKKTEP